MTSTDRFTPIERTDTNNHLDQIPGVGVHVPYWATVDCPECGHGFSGAHPDHEDILACKECDDDWPCDVVANVAAELERHIAIWRPIRDEMRDVDDRNVRSSALGLAISDLERRASELRGEV